MDQRRFRLKLLLY